ncbi:unnamed protein product [Arctogadus glacialis]
MQELISAGLRGQRPAAGIYPLRNLLPLSLMQQNSRCPHAPTVTERDELHVSSSDDGKETLRTPLTLLRINNVLLLPTALMKR